MSHICKISNQLLTNLKEELIIKCISATDGHTDGDTHNATAPMDYRRVVGRKGGRTEKIQNADTACYQGYPKQALIFARSIYDLFS